MPKRKDRTLNYPDVDVEEVSFTPGASKKSIYPPRVCLREPEPVLLRRRRVGTSVIASSGSRSQSNSSSGKYESPALSRGEPQGAGRDCGLCTEFGRAEGYVFLRA